MARLCSKKAIDEVLPQRLRGWEGAREEQENW